MADRPSRRPVPAVLVPALVAAGAMALPAAAQAQGVPTVSRPVVQALPSSEALQLNAALSKLGRNPRDIDALVEAGDAAKGLGDYEAAVGFYRRADAIAPRDSRVKAGLAEALVFQGDPYAAIPLFDQAAAAGADPAKIAAGRGLAYDLIGDNATAQTHYRTALARKDAPDEVRLRFAISQAIGGDMKAADATLMPLLRKQDKAAWRTRAFAMAIGGDTKEAVKVTDTLLPKELAERLAPYLRYMPQLTKAQQAAAANLGAFPRASEIGRDDPRLAAYQAGAGQPVRVASADAGVAPQGQAPGAIAQPAASGRTAELPAVATARQPAPAARPGRIARDDRSRRAPPDPRPGRETQTAAPVSTRTSTRASTPSAKSPAAPTAMAAQRGASLPLPPMTAASATTAAASAPAQPNAGLPPGFDPQPTQPSPPVQPASASVPAAPPAPAPAPRPPSATPQPGFDLARLPAGQTPASPANPAPAPGPAPSQAAVPAPTPTPAAPPAQDSDFASIFNDLAKPTGAATPAAGAVDITRIAPAAPPPRPKPEPKPEAKPEPRPDAKAKPDAKARPEPKKEAAKPAPPSHPSRVWVQLGVGQKKPALLFDWRKLTQKIAPLKGRKAYVSEMGRTNRMLTGPFDSVKDANAFIAELKKAGLDDPYIWTSPAGQVVDALDTP